MHETGTLSALFKRHSMDVQVQDDRQIQQQPSSENEGAPEDKNWKTSGVFRVRRFKGMEGEILLTVQGLEKKYQQGTRTLNILQKLNLRLRAGEITALVGPSGSGKSTLLHILGLLDTPTGGQIIIGDQIVGKMNDRARTRLRNQTIGFVYQFHHLLPEFSAVENVALPLIISGTNMRESRDRAEEYLKAMGLAERLKHRPSELSGGEQQRVAIARALVNQPKLLFADEPTGNLDPETSQEVFEILLEQVHNRGIGALIATHNISLAEEMDRILELKGGKLVPY